METVLVTGATGLVGSNLCEALAAKGYKVKALIRETSNKSFLDTINNLEYVYCDLRNQEKLRELTKDVSKIFHCAAHVGLMGTLDTNHASVNIQGTKNLLEAAVFNKVKKFIYVSTLGVLGILKDHYNDREDAPYIKVGHPYYDTKIDAERLVMNYYNDKNLPVVVLRPGFIYGPRDRNGLPNIMPYLLKQQIVYVGSGNNDIALTSIKNLVQALLLASEKEEATGKIFNITDDLGITASQFVRELCKILEIPEPKLHVPIPVASSIARTVENVSKLISRDTMINEYTIALLSNNHHFDVSRARKELGYKPVDSFEDDLKEAVHWYVKTHSREVREAEQTAVRNKKAAMAGFSTLTGILLLYLISRKLEKNKA